MKEFEIKTEKVWYWPTKLYVKPFALSMEDWETFDNKVKKEFPLQYFFRDILVEKYWIWRRKLNDLWWKIKNHIRNPRKEMKSTVFPSEYRDLPEIIFNFNSEVVKEIYEREKYFEHWSASSDCRQPKRQKFEKELKKYYKYITVDRNKMYDQVNELMEKNHKIPFKQRDDKWVKKLDQIDKLDNKMCIWVSSNREYFWT